MRLPDRAEALAAQITGVSTFLISITCSCCFVVLAVSMGIKFPWFRRQLRLGSMTQMTATLEANVKKEPSARATNVPSQGVFKRWDMEEAGPPPEPPRVVVRKDRPAPPVPRSQSLPPASRRTEVRKSEPPPVVPVRTLSTKEDRRKEKLLRKAEEERLKEQKRQEILQRRVEEKALRKSQKGKKRASDQPQPKEEAAATPPLPKSLPPQLPATNQAPELPPKQNLRRTMESNADAPIRAEAQTEAVEAINKETVRVGESSHRVGVEKVMLQVPKAQKWGGVLPKAPQRSSEPPQWLVELTQKKAEPVLRVMEAPPADAFVVSGTEVKAKKKDKKKDRKKTKDVIKSAPPSRRNPRALQEASSRLVEPPSPPTSIKTENVVFEKMNGQEKAPKSEVLTLQPPVVAVIPRSPRPAAKNQSRPRLPVKKKAPRPVAPPRIYTPPVTPPPEYEYETFSHPENHDLSFKEDGILSFRLPDAPEPMEVHPSFLALVRGEESDECDA